jgi:pyruvate dehydrogenase E1 component alpha subunit
MLKIRKFEERTAALLESDEIKCPTHLYIGQEAIAAGVCANLYRADCVFSSHRSHGHFIAKGGGLNVLMAELYGKNTGCSGGRGGSMHVAAPEIGLLGSSAIVGGSLPLSVGAALASNMQGGDHIVVVFFGDGATDEGVFFECINFAALYKLPVVFVCENNLFSTHLPLCRRQPEDNLYEKARVHGVRACRVDGNDVVEVYLASRRLTALARKGQGPGFLECRTYRWRAHVGPSLDLDVGLRRKEEVQKWMRRCPIRSCERILLECGALAESENAEIHSRIDQEVEDAVVFARQSPFPDRSKLLEGVYRIQGQTR